MKFSILRMTKSELEVELDERDPTLVELLAEELASNKSVEMVAPKWDHPLVGQPKLYLKVKKGNPADILKEAISSLINKFKELKNEL